MAADQEREARRRSYEAELEPVVAESAPKVEGDARVLLGAVRDLVPSRTVDGHRVTAEDELWYEALGAVAHRYGLTYELIGEDSGGEIWLIPPSGTR
jgi:hypothetical protein